MEQNQEKKQNTDNTNHKKWQRRVLPFIVGMPVLLAIMFIYTANKQVSEFYNSVHQKKSEDLIGNILPAPDSSVVNTNEKYVGMLMLLYLEQKSLDNRYNQAGLLVMSRVLTKYLGFFTGMILAILGAVFIIGKLSESKSNINADITDEMKFNIVSSSPGIIFGLLGTILMITTIIVSSEIKVTDQPLFLNAYTLQVISGNTNSNSGVTEIEEIPDSALAEEDKTAKQ